MKSFITSLAILICICQAAVAYPLIKFEKETYTETDTLSKETTETHIYTYPMINKYGLRGTYVEEFTYNSKGVLLSTLKEKHTAPYYGSEENYLVTMVKTYYNSVGRVTSIQKIKKMTNDLFIKKHTTIKIDSDGNREVVKAMKNKNTKRLSGYKKPSLIAQLGHIREVNSHLGPKPRKPLKE